MSHFLVTIRIGLLFVHSFHYIQKSFIKYWAYIICKKWTIQIAEFWICKCCTTAITSSSVWRLPVAKKLYIKHGGPHTCGVILLVSVPCGQLWCGGGVPSPASAQTYTADPTAPRQVEALSPHTPARGGQVSAEQGDTLREGETPHCVAAVTCLTLWIRLHHMCV